MLPQTISPLAMSRTVYILHPLDGYDNDCFFDDGNHNLNPPLGFFKHPTANAKVTCQNNQCYPELPAMLVPVLGASPWAIFGNMLDAVGNGLARHCIGGLWANLGLTMPLLWHCCEDPGWLLPLQLAKKGQDGWARPGSVGEASWEALLPIEARRQLQILS